MEIKKGVTFYMKHRKGYKHHIVTILKDEPEAQVVYKYYGKHKQWWHYEIEPLLVIKKYIEVGLIYQK